DQLVTTQIADSVLTESKLQSVRRAAYPVIMDFLAENPTDKDHGAFKIYLDSLKPKL
ncbi:unnamed protein product, partial [Symbiodinium microadriaticum]